MFVPSVTARNGFQFAERLLVYLVQFLRVTNVHAEQRIIYGAVKVEKSYEETCLTRFVRTRRRRNFKRYCFLSGIVINRWQRAMHEGRSLEVVGVGNFLCFSVIEPSSGWFMVIASQMNPFTPDQ